MMLRGIMRDCKANDSISTQTDPSLLLEQPRDKRPKETQVKCQRENA